MNAKERFKIIVDSIEEMVKENTLSNHEISDRAFDKANFPKEDREKNVLFEFLMEKKVLEYISERRLMTGYKYLLNEKDKDIAYKKANDLSGSSDQSGYITKFKKLFNGLTPLEARNLRDVSLFKSAPTWESLTGEDKENEGMKDTIFDIPKEHFAIVQKALNLQDFYSLNENESELAYTLYKDGKDMEKAFEYIANYLAGKDIEDRDARLKLDLLNDNVKYLYFDCNYGFDDIFIILLMQYLKQFSKPIREIDPLLITNCLKYMDNNVWNLPKELSPTFEEKYNYYLETATDKYTELDLELYLYYLRSCDYKKAFSMINPGLTDRKKLKRIIRKYEGFEDDYEKYLDAFEGYDPDEEDYYENDIEPEVWDDYMANNSSFDMNADEDDWVAESAQGYEPMEQVMSMEEEDELYDFDVDEFERLCMEMSETNDDEIKSTDLFGRRLSEYSSLDVESFWKEHCLRASS